MAKPNQAITVAGITSHGTFINKVRFTVNLVRRIKQFAKVNASRIDLVELPNPMSRLEAIAYLKTHADFQSAEDQATLDEAVETRTPKTPKVKAVKAEKVVKTPKVKAVKVAKAKVVKTAAKPTLDAIKARAKKAPVKTETPEVA